MARSVRDVALALDLVTGTDPEDPVTAEANAHVKGSFAAGLDSASLKGVRIGLLRQRLVGITGEREAAEATLRAADELRAAGATVVDVAISDYDTKYAEAGGAAPGALAAGWRAYLSRGAAPGERVRTIEDLIASGRMAPGGQRRLERALEPVPSGPELEAAVARFVAARERFRQHFIDLLESERLDALLYPANHARPHTHEGGAERYGGEPGTCQESATTGLPQVTVPAGFMGGRYPVGISFLGRMWDDARLLGIAHAYETATRHRRPPDVVRQRFGVNP
jgi:Asp-tRNA(Asn)/Glu-tRNA(Gln) amidotransferase A subunit family amidase